MTDDVHVRALARADLPMVALILDRTGLFPSAMLAEMAAPFLDRGEPAIWLVAESGGTITGFAYCEPERMTDGTFNLLAIAVDPDVQGRGHGCALLRRLEDRLRATGARLLLVETSGLPEYAGTRAFYAARGFSQEARVRDFYQAGEDKIIFRREL